MVTEHSSIAMTCALWGFMSVSNIRNKSYVLFYCKLGNIIPITPNSANSCHLYSDHASLSRYFNAIISIFDNSTSVDSPAAILCQLVCG